MSTAYSILLCSSESAHVCAGAHLIGGQLVGQVGYQLLALDVAAAVRVDLLKRSPRILLPQIPVPPLCPAIIEDDAKIGGLSSLKTGPQVLTTCNGA